MMQRNEIEKYANNVLKQYGIDKAPFSHIKEICDRENIKLKRTNFSSKVDGAFSTIRGEKFIFYNPQMPDGRKNFTKAHELGHYFLNHQLEAGDAIYCYNQGICEYNQKSLPRIETEANYFASFFLLPKDMVIYEYGEITRVVGIDTNRRLYVDSQDYHLRDWGYVSRHFINRFGVSKEALGYRLDSLGLIEYKL